MFLKYNQNNIKIKIQRLAYKHHFKELIILTLACLYIFETTIYLLPNNSEYTIYQYIAGINNKLY